MTTAKGPNQRRHTHRCVFAHRKIYDACMQGPEGGIELFHGYTYSAHPVACAAGLATLDIYQKEGLLRRAGVLEPAMGRRDALLAGSAARRRRP